MGVKTIVSVDGAAPNVETARRFGLRYVHLPHGYDGIPADRACELAKAVSALPHPIYVHCHHGKHRSPAAASVACVGAGLIPRRQAAEVLRLAGTSDNYRGLWRSAADARAFDAELLDALDGDFPQQASVPPMAEAMVLIEHTCDRLELLEQAGWRAPNKHPDLDPAHEALMLREHFTELLRTDEVAKQKEPFREMLRESNTAAERLERALRGEVTVARAEEARGELAKLKRNCTACHRQFRDVPLGLAHGEKKRPIASRPLGVLPFSNALPAL